MSITVRPRHCDSPGLQSSTLSSPRLVILIEPNRYELLPQPSMVSSTRTSSLEQPPRTARSTPGTMPRHVDLTDDPSSREAQVCAQAADVPLREDSCQLVVVQPVGLRTPCRTGPQCSADSSSPGRS